LILMGTRGEANLAACCSRWLKKDLNKEHQLRNWTGILTQEQLIYAADDVLVLRPLLILLNKEIDGARLRQAADIELRCLPAIVWMAQSGVAFDMDAWKELGNQAEKEACELRQQLDQIAAGRSDGQLFDGSWNWDSPAQVKQALANLGVEVTDTNDESLAKVDNPLAQRIRDYREVRKRVTSYGDKWAKHIHTDGRVYPHWRQIGASSGRMACSEPNMQNLPRGNYRRCIVAPPGRVLIKADYSQIELRIAAKLTGDPGLLEAYKNGEDLHERTARMVLGVQEVTKEHRQLAKALNFGLLYGMGAKGFRAYARTSYGVELSEEEAIKYRRAFFEAYPGLARWHRQVGNSQNTPIECRTLTGRRCCGVQFFNEKLNLPVQGTGADGLKAAIGLMWERWRQVPDVVPVLAVHDEIVVEIGEPKSEPVTLWLKQLMIDAMAPMIKPIPVEVHFTLGTTWLG
jgi:DNA polymerase I